MNNKLEIIIVTKMLYKTIKFYKCHKYQKNKKYPPNNLFVHKNKYYICKWDNKFINV